MFGRNVAYGPTRHTFYDPNSLFGSSVNNWHVSPGTYCLVWNNNLRRMIFEDEERRDPLGDLLGGGGYRMERVNERACARVCVCVCTHRDNVLTF